MSTIPSALALRNSGKPSKIKWPIYNSYLIVFCKDLSIWKAMLQGDRSAIYWFSSLVIARAVSGWGQVPGTPAGSPACVTGSTWPFSAAFTGAFAGSWIVSGTSSTGMCTLIWEAGVAGDGLTLHNNAGHYNNNF